MTIEVVRAAQPITFLVVNTLILRCKLGQRLGKIEVHRIDFERAGVAQGK